MSTATCIDVRTIAPTDRHSLIFSAFGALAAGQALELVNDHDPRPLFQQFAARVPGEFEWRDLQRGPDTWRAAITRIARPAHAGGRCCGACGGA